MTTTLGTIGVWQFTGNATPELAAEVEALGYGTFWLGGSPDGDLAQVDALLGATERIGGRYPGRFMLGVGVGHREAIQEYRNPYDKIVEYLDQLDEAGVPPEQRMLAALGPKVLELSAARTAGAHPYLTTPEHTAFARKIIGPDALLAPEHKVV